MNLCKHKKLSLVRVVYRITSVCDRFSNLKRFFFSSEFLSRAVSSTLCFSSSSSSVKLCVEDLTWTLFSAVDGGKGVGIFPKSLDFRFPFQLFQNIHLLPVVTIDLRFQTSTNLFLYWTPGLPDGVLSKRPCLLVHPSFRL